MAVYNRENSYAAAIMASTGVFGHSGKKSCLSL